MMTTADIDQALRVLNIEPLYGHSPYNPTTFRRALPFPQVPAAGPVYFVEDEEIDFDRVLREEKIALPKGVSWTAHWLAVEGVQPLIPENPPAIPRDTDVDPTAKSDLLKLNGLTPAVNGVVNGLGLPSTTNGPLGTKKPTQSQQLVKQVLSRELQLYYVRLTSSLLPPSSDMPKRTAALASLRSDAGLQALLPYLVRWVAEGVVNALKEGSQAESVGKELEVLLDVISSILDNNTLFVEPYVSFYPIYPFFLCVSTSVSYIKYYPQFSLQAPHSTFNNLSITFPTYNEDASCSHLSRKKITVLGMGAIRGLVGVGEEAIRKGLVESGGAKFLEQNGSLEKEGDPLGWSIQSWCVWLPFFLESVWPYAYFVGALRVLQSTSDINDPLDKRCCCPRPID